MPDGTARKLLDISKINNFGRLILNFNGIALTYDWYTENLK